MFRRVLILCLMVTVPLSGCQGMPRSGNTIAVAEGMDEEGYPLWFKSKNPDNGYPFLVCAGYMLILAAAAGAVWALAAAESANRGNRFP